MIATVCEPMRNWKLVLYYTLKVASSTEPPEATLPQDPGVFPLRCLGIHQHTPLALQARHDE